MDHEKKARRNEFDIAAHGKMSSEEKATAFREFQDAKNPTRAFKDGDVVGLTSGGIGMTVVGLNSGVIPGRQESKFFYDLMYFDGNSVLQRVVAVPELSLKLLREKNILLDPFEVGFENVVLNGDAFNYAIDAASEATRAGYEEQKQLEHGIKAYLVAIGALSQ